MILITGATGFIGARLHTSMRNKGIATRLLIRQPSQLPGSVHGSLADTHTLLSACAGVDLVFHCAGHAHAFHSLSGVEAKCHWQVNFVGTRNLVESAAEAGVQRFVFLSSVKAMAQSGDACVDEDFPGQPDTAYGQSKRAAEEAVLEVGARHGMHVVNLRLAMVYGSGGRGNLERMARLVRMGWFPPLPETGNHRSLVHVEDVVAAMSRVANDDRASGRTYIIAGQDAPSGRQLYDAMRVALGRPPSRWTVPEAMLRTSARYGDSLEAVCKRRMPLDSEALDRLLGSAWYSPARIERELGWRAEVRLEDGLREMLSCSND